MAENFREIGRVPNSVNVNYTELSYRNSDHCIVSEVTTADYLKSVDELAEQFGAAVRGVLT